MAAYFIADIEVTDPKGFEEYRQQVTATIEQYGGRYLARGGQVSHFEGEWYPTRVVVVEFPSREQASAWYNSRGYDGPKRLRQKAAVTNLILVEGI